MYRTNFTDYDEKPEGMVNYLRYYGPHFNKKLCDFAASLMYKENDEPIVPATKEDLRNLLLKYNIKLKHD